MIQITGEVKYPITLDSTTWILMIVKSVFLTLNKAFLTDLNPLNLMIIENGIVPYLKVKQTHQHLILRLNIKTCRLRGLFRH